MLYPRFRRLITTNKLVKPDERVVIGVSGGVDSMVLQNLFLRLQRSRGVQPIVAHVNHQRRGRDSDADEALVRRTAKEHDIPCHVCRATAPGKGNFQEGAREQRRDFFQKVAAKEGAQVIALAHHQVDQAETILLNVIRGTGLAGLGGMQVVDRLGEYCLLRPLLDRTRDDILAYAKKERIIYRHDASNDSLHYRRNDIRHRLLPLLAEFNPRIVRTIATMGERLGEDERALATLARECLSEVLLAADRDQCVLSREAYLRFPHALRARLLMEVFRQLTGGHKRLNADQLQRMDFLASTSGKQGTYRLQSPWCFSSLRQHLIIGQPTVK